MNELAIVGIFFDGYYDIWEDFLELFFSRWPDCPYRVYIVNNTADLHYSKTYPVEVIHAGEDAEYSKKIQVALEKIDAKYLLVLLEDFFVFSPLERGVLFNITEYIVQNDIQYYRMDIPDFRIKKQPSGKPVQIEPTSEYTISCQPSIWNRSFLAKCIGTDNYNAWVFEGIYARAQMSHTEKFLSQCRIDLSNPLSLRHGAVQGKLLPNVYQDFIRNGYVFKNKREVLRKRYYYRHRLKQIMKTYCPAGLQSFIKKIVGADSVLDRYEEAIHDEMRKMNME